MTRDARYYPLQRPIIPSRCAWISPIWLVLHTLWLRWRLSLLTTCSFHPWEKVVSGNFSPCGCNGRYRQIEPDDTIMQQPFILQFDLQMNAATIVVPYHPQYNLPLTSPSLSHPSANLHNSTGGTYSSRIRRLGVWSWSQVRSQLCGQKQYICLSPDYTSPPPSFQNYINNIIYHPLTPRSSRGYTTSTTIHIAYQ